MEPKLGGVRSRIEEFLQERGELERGLASSPSNASLLPRLFHDYAELTRPDTFFEVRELLEAQPKGSEARRRMERACAFLVEVAVDARSAESDARLLQWEATSNPWPDEPGLTVTDALWRIPREANRGRRALLARAVARDLEAQDRHFARRIDAAHEVAERLEIPSVVGLYQQFSPTDLAKLEQDGQALIARTEDAYRDLLGYVLRRAEPTLRPGTAERHDLDRALIAPWMFADTSAKEAVHAARRWIEEWGLPAGAGRIDLDTGDRPGKSPVAQVIGLRVPDRIFVSVRTEVGIADLSALLRAEGAAFSLALRDAKAPFEDRRLADRWVEESFAALFARMMVDPRWIERYLRVPKATARELARLSAFHELTRLREGAARLSYELELLRRGPHPELRDVYEDLFRKALGVSAPRGVSLHGLSRHLRVAAALSGGAVAAAIVPAMRNRFDEDYWRNPNAGGFLREVAARSGAAETFSVVAPKALEAPVADAGRELVAVMGA